MILGAAGRAKHNRLISVAWLTLGCRIAHCVYFTLLLAGAGNALLRGPVSELACCGLLRRRPD